HTAFQLRSVNDYLNTVAVADLADGAAGQRFGADVTDAGPRRDAGEAGVGQDGDVLAETQVLEGRGHLGNLFHAGAHRTAANEGHDIASLNANRPLPLDGSDHGLFGREHLRGADLAIDAVGVHYTRIDGSALDDRSFGGQIAARKGDGRRQAAGASAL